MTDKKEEIEKLEKRAEFREELIEKIVKDSQIIQNFPNPENFLVLARQWNCPRRSEIKRPRRSEIKLVCQAGLKQSALSSRSQTVRFLRF